MRTQRNHLRAALAAVALIAASTVVAATADSPPVASIPLCPGLTIVTAVSQRDGDYESIKTIESVTDSQVQLKYSAERMVQDWLSADPPKLQTFTIRRNVRRADLRSAFLYLQQFSTELPEMVPETTAIGTSADVLNALKTKGEARLGIFIQFSQNKPSLDRNVHPNVYDNQMLATVTRANRTPVMMPVIVNDVAVTLPTLQAGGDFLGDKSEFFFVDDPANPLTLKFRIGIGGTPPLSPEAAKVCETSKGSALSMFLGGGRCDLPNGGDRDTLRVVKITYRCASPTGSPSGTAGSGAGQPPAGAGAAGTGGANALEQALATTGKADVYSIYFSFNSDVIREESEPTLKDIVEVLRRHPDWRLAVNGHTDGIGTDPFNLDLSRRRSAAVKDALAKRYSVTVGRLTTSGFGKSQPKDTNETLEGRARNRRVELVRLP